MNNDLISREALRKAFHERIYYFNKSSWDEANAIIDNAPTVEYPFYQAEYQTGYEEGKNERPTGEWVDEYWEDAYQEYYHTCSICKKDMRTSHCDNFCPNCGARMRKGEEE